MADIHSYNTSAASNNSASPNGFPESMAPSGVNDSAREVMAALARWYQDQNGTLTSTGSSNAYVVAGNQTYTALNDIGLLVFRANFGNTGAATLNVDSLGAKSIKKNHDQDLASGDIEANQLVVVAYNATDDTFELVSDVGNFITVLDEDDFSTDSATNPPSQQSTKAYVDAQTSSLSALYTGGDVLAQHENLAVNTDASTPDEQIDVTADAILLTDGAGNFHRVTSVNVTADNTASGEGGINTGSVAADTWYYIYVISDGGSNVGCTLSTSIADPAVSGRDYYGLVGAVLTDATSDFIEFRQYGAIADFDVQQVDLNTSVGVATAQTLSLTAPPNTKALISVHSATANTSAYTLLTSLEQTDSTPSSSLFDLYAAFFNGGNTVIRGQKELYVRTNGSSQIRHRSSASLNNLYIATKGWRFQ